MAKGKKGKRESKAKSITEDDAESTVEKKEQGKGKGGKSKKVGKEANAPKGKEGGKEAGGDEVAKAEILAAAKENQKNSKEPTDSEKINSKKASSERPNAEITENMGSRTNVHKVQENPRTESIHAHDNLEPDSKKASPEKRPKLRSNQNRSCGSCPEPRSVTLKYVDDEYSDSTEVESSTDEEERWKDIARGGEIPADYYNIQKLIKFIKAGNQTATIVALCCLKDYNLTEQINQFAIQDIGGLDVLVNILECNDIRCRLGALIVMSQITLNIDIRKTIVDLGGVPLIVANLNSPQKTLKSMAAATLANVAKVRLARKFVRTCGGIPKLVDLLDIKSQILKAPLSTLKSDELETLNMATAGARALWSLADSRHNKELMRKSGIVPLMARLLKSCHMEIVIPIMGTLQKCASEPKFQLAITTEGMIADIVAHLSSLNDDLRTEGSHAIYKCAFDQTTRDLVRQAGGLEPLVAIIKNKAVREDKLLLRGATGALWMCAVSDANVRELESLGVIKYLVALLEEESNEVLTNVAGAIAECVRFQSNRVVVRQAGGLSLLVALLNSSHPPLLENLAKALKECAEDEESMRILEDLDAVRLIWSLLKNSNAKVQAYAAFAICPCIKNARDSGELVRSLVGAMELVVGLLKSKDSLVLSAVCAAIATIAMDETNLAILTDLKVIYKLAGLVHTDDDLLRRTLAAAISSCAGYADNTQELGRLRAVTPVVTYMSSNDPLVHQATAMALEKLSMDPQNCITMHQSGVVPFLLECVGATDKRLQLAAAGCLRNIRELALHTEEYILKIDDD